MKHPARKRKTEIREHIVQFYRLFTEQFYWRPKMDGIAFDSIEEEEASWLEQPYKERGAPGGERYE